jgi:hypothetical protein
MAVPVEPISALPTGTISDADYIPFVDVANNLTKKTTKSALGAAIASAVSGWNNLGYTPSTVTYNGNRSYSLVFNSVDLTSIVSTGMRFRTTRTLTAPTQCTSLNGTTQYYSKTSPAGTTFTATYTAMAWVKLSSYQSGMVISRHDGSTGWWLQVNAVGQIVLRAQSATGAREATSSASLPLNKWVHIAASWDLGAGTGLVYMDGAFVTTTATGTAITTLTQAGTLMVGNSGSAAFFNGKIAQAAIFSTALSAATIRTYCSQTLSGTETSLVSAYSFNNSVNDLNITNANNLTINGAAVATNADSPFTRDDTGTPNGTTDYGVITSKSFSTNTTLTVLATEGCAVPTTGGLSAIGYSATKVPFGFPGIDNSIFEALLLTTFSNTTVAGTDIYGATTGLITPPTNRSIRLVAQGKAFKTGSAGDQVTISLYEDSVIRATWEANMAGSNYGMPVNINTPTFKPTSGSHTYKLAISASAAGTMQFVGGLTNPAFLRLEVVDL